MKKIPIIILGMLVSFTSVSCYYDTLPEEVFVPLPDGVSYAADVQPIWNQSCVSCHEGDTPPDLRAANSFNVLLNDGWVIPGDPDASILFKSLTGDGGVSLMPPGNPMTSQRINIVRQWILEGALDN
ncbi:MAG: c-type cytochrome domain-containing protein [Flavobacteriaceae bacterium]|nr:c-type cytochrome domain-containing protein [Flavobacteriaceae bacterium]